MNISELVELDYSGYCNVYNFAFEFLLYIRTQVKTKYSQPQPISLQNGRSAVITHQIRTVVD